LLADIPDVEFIIFDKSRGIAAYRDLRIKLRGRRFDVALCMHASMRANVIYPLIRTPLRLGYNFGRARDFQWLFTNRRVAPDQQQHVQDAMMAFAHCIGVPARTLRWDIPLSEAHREFAAQFRSSHRPLFLISPCSSQRSRNFRNWSADNYAAAARYAQQKFGCRIVLSGGATPEEEEYGVRISQLTGSEVVNLIGKTNLKQLLALIDEAAALLCPDSGPAHMATTVRTPVIGLYATSNPGRTGPYFSRDLTVNAYPEAAEKYLRTTAEDLRWGQRVRDPGAMGLIRLGKVTARIDAIFGAARQQAILV
jgi:heptosyltransferase I